jgi:tetrahydromethanopterin S-methyltransferase subunit G
MGFIEDGRQLFQDFVAPEIRAIEARLDAVEKQIASLEAKMDKRIDQLEVKLDRTSSHLEAEMSRNQAQVMDTLHRMENYAQVMERLARLEGKLQNVA